MIATIKMPRMAIPSVCPACISSDSVGLTLVGDTTFVWVGVAVCVTLGVRVPVTATLMAFVVLGVRVGVNTASAGGVMAMFKSARSKKRIEMFMILSFLVIVPKFTKKGDGVSPQYNTAERGYFLSNFNL